MPLCDQLSVSAVAADIVATADTAGTECVML